MQIHLTASCYMYKHYTLPSIDLLNPLSTESYNDIHHNISTKFILMDKKPINTRLIIYIMLHSIYFHSFTCG